MLNRRSILVSAALAALLPFTFANSAEMPASPADFHKANAEGKSIVIDVSAPWCPTCRAQAPILEKLSQSEKFRNVLVLKIDFDSQQDFLASLNVRQQSTLIAFKGGQEVGRSVGDTRASSIEDLFAKAL